jgi:hypothetical protein
VQPLQPKKLIFKATLNREEVLTTDGIEPIHEKWITNMKVKIIGQTKNKEGTNDDKTYKQIKMYHRVTTEEDHNDCCTVNIHNLANLDQLTDYYRNVINTYNMMVN